MRWHDLLFMHWPVPVDALRPQVPSALEIETFPIPAGPHAGMRAAWLGVVPFRMTGVRHCLLPALPALGSFPEINVRTYVRGPGDASTGGEPKPGVWFISLDVPSLVAAAVARAAYHLNYLVADMRCDTQDNNAGVLVHYVSTRADARGGAAAFAARYSPDGPEFRAAPGSLESFLTDRYCLYSADKHGRVFRAEIDHASWPLQPAACRVRANTMAAPLGIDLARVERRTGPPLLHFARSLRVRAWMPRRVL
jgi:uncharacterized protein YqjF (DUF2071 family)